ncbi:hypothetical protein [Streptomyces sp. NPDC007063]
MAERLPDDSMQALQQFVSQSTWDHASVLRAAAFKGRLGGLSGGVEDRRHLLSQDGNRWVGAARQ